LVAIKFTKRSSLSGDHFGLHKLVECFLQRAPCDAQITPGGDIFRQARIGLQYLLKKRGPLTVSAGYAAAFVRTREELKRPDAQIYFINFSTARRGGVLHRHSGFTCSVSQLQVESRGSVRIGSADPAAPPAIRYNYLATENDRRVMVEGLKLVRRIVNTPPRGIGDSSVKQIQAFALAHGLAFWNTLEVITTVPGLSTRAVNSIKQFVYGTVARQVVASPS
jgi:choline dehydrogenase-like flavoprotein